MKYNTSPNLTFSKHELVKAIKITILVLGFTLGATYAYAVWTGPTDTPPNANTPPPINVGTSFQDKDGDVWFNSVGLDGGLTTVGKVGVGVSAPIRQLDVVAGTGVVAQFKSGNAGGVLIDLNSTAVADAGVRFQGGNGVSRTYWAVGNDGSLGGKLVFGKGNNFISLLADSNKYLAIDYDTGDIGISTTADPRSRVAISDDNSYGPVNINIGADVTTHNTGSWDKDNGIEVKGPNFTGFWAITTGVSGGGNASSGLGMRALNSSGSVIATGQVGLDPSGDINIKTFEGNVNLLPETGGRIGINTTNPSYTLHISGSVGGSGGFYHTSDERFKKNISAVQNALESVEQINGVFFDWRVGEFADRGFEDGRQIGVIAQEVEGVIPEVVSEDDNGYKSVDYGRLSALLIEAIKELKAENEELRARLDALESTK